MKEPINSIKWQPIAAKSEWLRASAGRVPMCDLGKVYNLGLNLVSQRQEGTVYYFVQDGHNSTRIPAYDNGTVQNVFAYDACGRLIAAANSFPLHRPAMGVIEKKKEGG